MAGKSVGKVVVVSAMVALGVALAVWFTIHAIIPVVRSVSAWVGNPDSRGILIVLVLWAVCGLVVYFLAGLCTESVGWRIFLALLGVVALTVMVLVFSVRLFAPRQR